ncbi:hypothetical protein NL676_012718 [Syzygium grande]|nr:hypothetical protein NL676_012718 [Syzygium grande]
MTRRPSSQWSSSSSTALCPCLSCQCGFAVVMVVPQIAIVLQCRSSTARSKLESAKSGDITIEDDLKAWVAVFVQVDQATFFGLILISRFFSSSNGSLVFHGVCSFRAYQERPSRAFVSSDLLAELQFQLESTEASIHAKKRDELELGGGGGGRAVARPPWEMVAGKR